MIYSINNFVTFHILKLVCSSHILQDYILYLFAYFTLENLVGL